MNSLETLARAQLTALVRGQIGPYSFQEFADGSPTVALPVAGALCHLNRPDDALRVLASLNPREHPQVIGLARDILPDVSPALLLKHRPWFAQLTTEYQRTPFAPTFPLLVRALADRGHFELVETVRSDTKQLLRPADWALIDATRACWDARYDEVLKLLESITFEGIDAPEAELLRAIARGMSTPLSEVSASLGAIAASEMRNGQLRETAARWRAEFDVRRGDWKAASTSLHAASDHPALRLVVALSHLERGDDKGKQWSAGFHEWVIESLRREGGVIDGGEPARLWKALACFGGNRSNTVTTVDGGAARVVSIRTAREHAIDIQAKLPAIGPDAVLAELEAFERDNPQLLMPLTYRGEVLLWLGRYAEAAVVFEEAARRGVNRWIHVGLGRAYAGLGRHADAQRTWEKGERLNHGRLPGEATWVYLAEAANQAGRVDEARAMLTGVLRANPNRLGGWMTLAETEALRGDSAASKAATDRAKALCPGLFADAGERWSLRGNVSSWMYTWFDGAGQFHAFAHVVPDRLARALEWIDRVGNVESA